MSQLIDLKITQLRQSITKSGLNFLLRESPFGLKIEIRKSLARPSTNPQDFNPSIPPPSVNPSLATALAPDAVRPPCSKCPGLVAVAASSKKAAADALCKIKSLELKQSASAESLERSEVARNAAVKDVSLLQNEIAALKISSKIEQNTERLEKSEIARNAAEKQVSLLQNELKALKSKSDDEKSQLKSEISTKADQLKRKNKTLEQNESKYKREKEITEKNTQALEKKITILLNKNSHLQKKLNDALDDSKKIKSEAKKEKKRIRGKEKACQTFGTPLVSAQPSHQNPGVGLCQDPELDQYRNKPQSALNASPDTVEEMQNVAPACLKGPNAGESLSNAPDNTFDEGDKQQIAFRQVQALFTPAPPHLNNHGQEDSVPTASDDDDIIEKTSESPTPTKISVSPFPNLSPLQRVQQEFLFHHNVLKQRPTQEELNIERYKSKNRYSPHLPPSNTAAINLQLHTLSQTSPDIISSYQNVDNLINCFKKDASYDDPDSIYPALCVELEKITPKDLTASKTSAISTGICANEAPASMIFQAQLAEFINISPEEDLRVKKNITAQPSRDPLPSSSTFQAQKKSPRSP